MVRSCGGYGNVELCQDATVRGVTATGCVCNGELCNGAGMAAVSTSLLMISVVLSKIL